MKKRILSIAAMVAAMLFAASCSKDDDTQNAPAPAPSTTETTETTEQKSETIAVPFSITVNQGNNSLTKAKLVEDGEKLVQKFVKGDELVITGEGLSTAEGEESVLKLDENDIDKESATFSGILYFVSTGEVTPSITLTATLRNISDENWNKGVKQLAPVVEPSSDEVNAEYMFTHYGYLKAEFKYKEGVNPTITLRQYTALLEFDLDFTSAKVNVRTIDNSDPNNVTIVNAPITLGKGVTYVAVPDGAVVTSQMIDNGKPWTIDLDKEYEDANSATVWYTITRTTPDNCIPALFSVSDKKQVFFSKGNLQYNPTATDKWRFAPTQYSICHTTGNNVGNDYSEWKDGDNYKWTDLFGWGMWLKGESPLKTEKVNSKYLPSITADLATFTTESAIGSEWETLTGGAGEWNYLFNSRGEGKYGEGTVDNVHGVILLPDEWTYPADITQSTFTPGESDWANTYTAADWAKMEANGAVFLPAAGYRIGTDVYAVGVSGHYWSSSASSYGAYRLVFGSGYVTPGGNDGRFLGRSVRLVRPLK